eukprot:gene29061-38115_t
MTVVSSCCSKLDAGESNNILAVQQMFMGYLSHEIRTPINSVYLGLTIVFNGLTNGVLDNQQTTNNSVVDTVVDTRKACQTAVDILDNMILYDQIIRGLMTMDMKFFDPLKHTSDIVNKFRTEASEANIELIVVDNMPLNSCIRLNGDQGMLSHVTTNLVSHAMVRCRSSASVTDTRSRSIIVTLSIEEGENDYLASDTDLEMGPFTHWRIIKSAYCSLFRAPKTFAESRHLRITVADTGVGISEENQLTVFNEGLRFTPGVIEQGNGANLGLYITKQIVEQHRGSISMVSSIGGDGCGSTFSVRLPSVTTAADRNEVVAGIHDDGSISPSSFRVSFDQDITTNNTIAAPNTDHTVSVLLTEQQPLMMIASTVEALDESKVLHVLVVDDSTLTRKMVCQILKMNGRCRCNQAGDGAIGVEMVRKSLYLEQPLDETMMKAGSDGVLTKPLNINTFWDTVRGLSG